MRWFQNLAGFAKAFPAPAPDIIFVPGRPGNPAGGTYWTVRYVVLNEVRTVTLYCAKNPTQDELNYFKNRLSDLANLQHWYTGEQDFQTQADLAYEQYVEWVASVREP